MDANDSAPSSSNGRIAFIATKPIQIITSMILAQQLACETASLSVVPNFADGLAVTDRLRRHGHEFASVSAARNRVLAIVGHGVRGAPRIFIDRDMGARTTATMRLVKAMRPQTRFALYEEGLSLLDPSLEARPRLIMERLGATPELGTGHLTEEVWTYSPDTLRLRLPSKRIYKIDVSLAAFMEQERSRLVEVFWPSYVDDIRGWGGERCCLYLSSWHVDQGALARLARSPGRSICKLHPHIRDQTLIDRGAVDQVLSPAIPAELVVIALARAFEAVEVLHDNTSTAHYISLPNVRFLQVDDAEATTAGLGDS